ncbi:MAG: hypothetical protein OXF23_03485, partial [Candidatus Dadabacteria bacterium]|nr:hypothetical protein [Candidatus Dadabacteria bacterium]
LLDNEQEIEIELGVEASDARKKILDLFKKGFEGMSGTPEDKEKTSKPVPKTKKTKARKVSTAKKTS